MYSVRYKDQNISNSTIRTINPDYDEFYWKEPVTEKGLSGTSVVKKRTSNGTWSDLSGANAEKTSYSSRERAKFKGWSENIDGSGTLYTKEQKETLGGNKDFYAAYDYNYDLKYNYNNGLNGTNTQQLKIKNANEANDTFLAAPTNYARATITYNTNGGSAVANNVATSKTFNGWKIGNTTYKASSGFKNVMGSSISTLTDGVATGQWIYNAITLPTTTKTGYTFKNWQLDGTSSTYSANAKYTPTSDNNVKFNANWTPNKYNVVYTYKDINTNKTITQNCEYDKFYNYASVPSVTMPKLTFNSAGGTKVNDITNTKSFTGWYANSSYTGTKYNADTSFKNLSATNGATVNRYGKFTYNTIPLPIPTREGYWFEGWKVGDTTYCTPNATHTSYNNRTYTINSEDDVIFVAQWKLIRRSDGKLNYNANGAVDKNNKEYSAVTDDNLTKLESNYTLKDGSIFGEKQTKDNTILGATKQMNNTTSYTYFEVKKGEVINSLGNKDNIASFQGWSANKFSTKKTSKDIIYNGTIKLLDIWCDACSVADLGYANTKPTNKTLEAVTNEIKSRSKTLKSTDTIPWNSTLQNSGIANVYAIWDMYPIIQTDKIKISSKDNITDELILNQLTVTDKEDGVLNKQNIKLDYDKEQLSALVGEHTCYSSITIYATDSAGNTTRKVVVVAMNQTNPLTREQQGFVRLISREYYNKPTEAEGGCVEDSVWYKNQDYVNCINEAFDNLENDNTYDQDWYFTHKQVVDVQKYIKDNGFGKTKSNDSLKNFHNKYAGEGCLKGDNMKEV